MAVLVPVRAPGGLLLEDAQLASSWQFAGGRPAIGRPKLTITATVVVPQFAHCEVCGVRRPGIRNLLATAVPLSRAIPKLNHKSEMATIRMRWRSIQ